MRLLRKQQRSGSRARVDDFSVIPGEIWQPLIRFTCYEASSEGRIRRSTPGFSTRVGRILKQRPSNQRFLYATVCLSINDQNFTVFVHVLVAEAFLGLCPEGWEVNHKDGVKANNRSNNLEYVTTPGNAKHAFSLGLRPVGEHHHMAVITDEQVREARQRYAAGERVSSIAKDFNCNKDSLSNIVHRRSRRYVD